MTHADPLHSAAAFASEPDGSTLASPDVADPEVPAGVAALFLAAVLALQTQQEPVERFNMPSIPQTERILTRLPFGLFGMGIGAVMRVNVPEFVPGGA